MTNAPQEAIVEQDKNVTDIEYLEFLIVENIPDLKKWGISLARRNELYKTPQYFAYRTLPKPHRPQSIENLAECNQAFMSREKEVLGIGARITTPENSFLNILNEIRKGEMYADSILAIYDGRLKVVRVEGDTIEVSRAVYAAWRTAQAETPPGSGQTDAGQGDGEDTPNQATGQGEGSRKAGRPPTVKLSYWEKVVIDLEKQYKSTQVPENGKEDKRPPINVWILEKINIGLGALLLREQKKETTPESIDDIEKIRNRVHKRVSAV